VLPVLDGDRGRVPTVEESIDRTGGGEAGMIAGLGFRTLAR
jgi:hypothetical protein